MDGLSLESRFEGLLGDQRVDLVFTIVQSTPGGTVCRSAIYNQVFQTDFKFPTEYGKFAFLQAVYLQEGSKHWLHCDATTTVIPHVDPSLQFPPGVIEACAGIGAVGKGYDACGIKTTCYIDNNSQFCRWLKLRGVAPVIEGDIASIQTVQQVANITSGNQILSGGVSCQPFSALGDRREQGDSRSRSFPALLRMGYFLNVVAIVMECTKEVMQSTWAQSILRQFGEFTGFRVVQNILNLHKLWPAYRTRWWAVVSHPTLPASDIPAMPDLAFEPGVIHVIPRMLKLSDNELEQLECDLYELRNFHTVKGGVHTCILNMLKPMPTATHSWGSQVKGCFCGCRASGFSLQRLQQHGLYATVWPLDSTVVMNMEEITRLRHLSPKEVALLCGLTPDHLLNEPSIHQRLTLAGVGQLASPLQSAWVMANFLSGVGRANVGFDAISPKAAIAKVVDELFQVRDKIWGITKNTPYMDIFQNAVTRLLHEDPTDDPFCNFTQEILKTVKQAEIHLQSNEASEAIIEDGDEIFSDQEIVNALRVQEKSQGDDSNVKSPNIIAEDGYDAGEWECPYDDCVVCSPSISIPKPGFGDQEPIGPSNGSVAITPTVPFQVEDAKNETLVVVSPFTDCGGIKAFSKKRQREDNMQEQTEDKGETPTFEEPSPRVGEYQMHKVTGEAKEVEPQRNASDIAFDQIQVTLSESGESHVIQVFTEHESIPVFVRTPKDATVGSITIAEDSLGTMKQPIGIRDSVGQTVPLRSTTSPFQQLFLHNVPKYAKTDHQHSGGPAFSYEKGQYVSRLQVLRQQESWVAVDEMLFYITNICQQGTAEAFAPFAEPCSNLREPIDSNTTTPSLQMWIEDLLVASTDATMPIISCFLEKAHWFPVMTVREETCTRVISSPEGLTILQTICPIEASDLVFHDMSVPASFRHDCGFQSIGWLVHLVNDPSIRQALCEGDKSSIPAFESASAVVWRSLFEQSLLVSGGCRELVKPHLMAFGGVTAADPPEIQVADLLHKHGVPEEEAMARANSVIEKLGRSKVIQALRTERSWAELKNVANQQQPKVQLVLPSELAQAIKDRADSGQAFGDKRKKLKSTGHAPAKGPLVLQPGDVSIPDGLFKQGESQLIRQINLASIRKDASGLVVVNASQAEPYIRLTQPLSSHGLALLVLDHQDPICNGVGQIIRFPGRFEKTGEPFIGTGRLIQLGSVEVCRFFPESQVKVVEVETQVLRAVVYRDETPSSWQEFSQRPVKMVLDHLGLAGGGEDDGVIDVWDRQWLSHKLDRQKPQQAEVFMVSLRLTGQNEKDLMSKSGEAGIYLEPRAADGRSPSDKYRVMWLPRTDKATTMTSLQAATTWACLVRAGRRFGLRTLTSDAQTVHDQYKPQVPFLDSGSIVHYSVGTLPYGVTKSNLSKVFLKWGWQARPVQPRGRSSDGGGILWEVHASQAPECEAYAMDHGDVIISELSRKKPNDRVVTDIIASAKTLAALQASQTSSSMSSGSNSKVSQDPWIDQDPWSGYAPITKVPRVAHQSEPSQAKYLENVNLTVDRKIAAAIAQVEQKILATSSDDSMTDAVEDRVGSIETRLTQMEHIVQSQQHQMQSHHTQVNNQLSSMQTQLDQQSQVFQDHLDSRMTEQLSQIEKLLGKKGRYE